MHKLTLLPFLLFSAFVGQAQFQKQVILEASAEDQEDVSFMIATDFTNDGIPEIIGRSFYSPTIYVLTQQPDSSYGNGKVLSANGEDWTFLKAGDLDGDNYDDLLIYKDNGQVLWMQNDRQGGFLTIQHLFEDKNADFLHADDLLVTDIDNDGRDDIIARLPNKIAWYQSQGNGVTDQQTLLTIDEDRTGLFENGQLAISKINPDGYRELALLADGTIHTANNASGAFAWKQTMPADTLQAGYMQWADMDQDGYQDLVVSDTYSWTGIYHLWYFIHGSDEKLNTDAHMLGETLFRSTTMQYVWSVFPEDIDSDGDTDIFVQIQPEGCDPASKTSSLGWLENQQNWSATAFHEIASKQAVAFADLDNDADIDVILKHTIGETAVWLRHERASFATHQLTKPRQITGSIKQAILADIDQNNFQDIVVSVGSDVVWFQGKQDYTFTEPSVLQSFAGFTGNFLEAANINQDPALELILPYQGTNNFNYIAYIGKDSSRSFINTQVSRETYLVFTGDIDQDGDLDILTAIDKKEYAWFENKEGVFKDYLRLGKVSTGTQLTGTADLDGDGDLDILTDQIWFKNEGNGNYEKMKSVGGAFAADIDSDGDLDILRSTSSGLQWYEQTSPGEFTQPTTLLDASGNFAIADMDSDGDPDIVTYNTQIVWWKNNGGAFSEQIVIAEEEAKTLAFADADHDTDMDIVAVVGNEVVFYRNPLQKAQLPPQDIVLSDTTVAENMPAGTSVAEIKGQAADTLLTFQLVAGEGGEDNAAFEVKGRELLTATTFDDEKKSLYAIRLQATDTTGLSFQKSFIIKVIGQENRAPIVVEKIPTQTVSVGQSFELVIPENAFMDEDSGDSLVYTVSLAGSDTLPSWLTFNAQARTLLGTASQSDSLSILVTTTDMQGASANQTFSLVIKDNITGIDHLTSQEVVRIYPNPVKHHRLFIEFNKIASEKTCYTFWNIEGKLVQSGRLHFYQNDHLAVIDLHRIKAGIYILEINSGTTMMRKKVIVE